MYWYVSHVIVCILQFQCCLHSGYLHLDIDECFEEVHTCLSDDNRKCNNTYGGFECICDNGYEEDSNGTCIGE